MLSYFFNEETLYNWSDIFIAGAVLVGSILVFTWLVLKLWPLISSLFKKASKSLPDSTHEIEPVAKAKRSIDTINGSLSGLDKDRRDQAAKKISHIEYVSKEVLKCAQASALTAETYGEWTNALGALLDAIDSKSFSALRAASGAISFNKSISVAVSTRVSFDNTPYWEEVRGMVSSQLVSLNTWGKVYQREAGALVLEISQLNQDILMLEAVIERSKSSEKLRLVSGHLADAENILRITPHMKKRILAGIIDSHQVEAPALMENY